MKKIIIAIALFTAMQSQASQDCTLHIATSGGMCGNEFSNIDLAHAKRLMARKGYEIVEDIHAPASYELRMKSSVDCGWDVEPQGARQIFESFFQHSSGYSVELKGPYLDLSYQDHDSDNLEGMPIGLVARANHKIFILLRKMPICSKERRD